VFVVVFFREESRLDFEDMLEIKGVSPQHLGEVDTTALCPVNRRIWVDVSDTAFDRCEAARIDKIDLGEQWTAMTGLPFIYAAWTGRTGAITPGDVEALQEAQAEGVRSTAAIASEYGRGDAARTARAAVYLGDNVKYGLGAEEAAGLQKFLDYAAGLGLAPRHRTLEFF